MASSIQIFVNLRRANRWREEETLGVAVPAGAISYINSQRCREVMRSYGTASQIGYALALRACAKCRFDMGHELSLPQAAERYQIDCAFRGLQLRSVDRTATANTNLQLISVDADRGESPSYLRCFSSLARRFDLRELCE